MTRNRVNQVKAQAQDLSPVLVPVQVIVLHHIIQHTDKTYLVDKERGEPSQGLGSRPMARISPRSESQADVNDKLEF